MQYSVYVKYRIMELARLLSYKGGYLIEKGN